jgi:hypothetical protein
MERARDERIRRQSSASQTKREDTKPPNAHAYHTNHPPPIPSCLPGVGSSVPLPEEEVEPRAVVTREALGTFTRGWDVVALVANGSPLLQTEVEEEERGHHGQILREKEGGGGEKVRRRVGMGEKWRAGSSYTIHFPKQKRDGSLGGMRRGVSYRASHVDEEARVVVTRRVVHQTT